jgi:hypothetical protein
MYVIAIPSYRRASLCNDKTLTMLSKHHIPKNIINVYVVEEELDVYQKTLQPHLYHKLIVGKKGLVQQREFIQSQYPEGQCIVFLDDDIDSVDLSLSTYTSLSTFLKDAFQITKQHHAYLWGVYPVFNPFFRKPRKPIETCLNYIVGAFYGIINRNLPSLRLTTTRNGQKEDVERTIRYFKEDGIVIRFSKIGFVTQYYGKEGGLGTFEKRLSLMKTASQRLKKKYPLYGEIKTKKSGMTEFRLHKTIKKY